MMQGWYEGMSLFLSLSIQMGVGVVIYFSLMGIADKTILRAMVHTAKNILAK